MNFYLNLIFQNGNIIPPVVKAGDEVVLPEYGGSKLTLDENDYFIYRETDIIAKYKPE